MEVTSHTVQVVQRRLPFATPLLGTLTGLLQTQFLLDMRAKAAPILSEVFLIWHILKDKRFNTGAFILN